MRLVGYDCNCFSRTSLLQYRDKAVSYFWLGYIRMRTLCFDDQSIPDDTGPCFEGASLPGCHRRKLGQLKHHHRNGCELLLV